MSQPGMTEAEWLYRQGTKLLDSDPQHAIEALTRSLELNPDAPPVLYNRAVAYSRVGRDAEAVADLARLERIAPSVAKPRRHQFTAAAGGFTSMAEEDFKAKKYEEAIKKCDSALAYNPHWGDAWVVKGLALEELGDLERALDCFNKGEELEPNNYFVYINRAELHQEEERFGQALADFTRAIELDPTDPDGYAGRSAVYASLKMLDKAAQDDATAKRLEAKREQDVKP
jgi:tetratricopeptide (TPR) repeat protein